MAYVYDALMFVALFVLIKTIQMIASFSYTTFKSLTIHKSWAHAFFPPLRDRLRYGLKGDMFYFAAGIFIVDRVNKMPLVLTFLGVYFLLFTVTAFVRDPRWVSEIFRAPDLEAVLFFAFIILTDPPTSPAKYPDQLICGTIVAVVSYVVFEWVGAVYYLLAGVLAGNVWEAWRRVNRRKGHTLTQGLGAFAHELAPWNASGTLARQPRPGR